MIFSAPEAIRDTHSATERISLNKPLETAAHQLPPSPPLGPGSLLDRIIAIGRGNFAASIAYPHPAISSGSPNTPITVEDSTWESGEMEDSASIGGIVAGLFYFVVGFSLIHLSWRSQRPPRSTPRHEFLPLGNLLRLLADSDSDSQSTSDPAAVLRRAHLYARGDDLLRLVYLGRISQSATLGKISRLRDRDQLGCGRGGIRCRGRLGRSSGRATSGGVWNGRPASWQ